MNMRMTNNRNMRIIILSFIPGFPNSQFPEFAYFSIIHNQFSITNDCFIQAFLIFVKK